MTIPDIIRRFRAALPGWSEPPETWTRRIYKATSVIMPAPHADAIALASVKGAIEKRGAYLESGLASTKEAEVNDRWYAVFGAYAGYGPTEIEAFLAACEAAKGDPHDRTDETGRWTTDSDQRHQRRD